LNRYVLPLYSAECTLSLAGGKGANLSRLMQANFPIPAGFVIATPAYKAFTSANQIDGQIREVVRSLPTLADPNALDAASQKIRNLFAAGCIPPELEQEVLAAHRNLTLKTPGVAVRSSATAEDLPGISFAGQHETYLNVRGEPGLLDAVKRCWSSLWTARALAYRAHHVVDPTDLSLAVVMQQMVPAEASGILFTINPMNGSSAEMLINAAWGLGEAVVGGLVTPDTLVVDKTIGRLKQTVIANKQVMTVASESGTSEEPVRIAQRDQASLDARHVDKLVHLGREIEAFFGSPQDIEWAMASDCIYVLQSRPVTGVAISGRASPGQAVSDLPPGDDDWQAMAAGTEHPFDLWTRANVGELWPDPVSPLVASTVPEIISGALQYALRGIDAPELINTQWAHRFFGRMYYNEGALRRIFWKELGLPISFVDRGRGNIQLSTQAWENKINLWKLLPRLPILFRLAARQWFTGRELELFIPQVDRWVEDFGKTDYTKLDDRALWAEVMVWVKRMKKGLELQNELTGYSLTALAALDRINKRWFKRQDLSQDLITGLSGIQAAEMGTSLWGIAQKLQEAGLASMVQNNSAKVALERLRQLPEAAEAMRLFDTFLKEHGHRCPGEAEWLHPRWAEAPEQVIELLAAYLRPDHPIDLGETQARQKQRREEAVAWAESRIGPLRLAIFRSLLRRVHHAARLRDNGKSSAIKASYPARRMAALWGVRWVERGWLEHPDDIFFLTFSDIQEIIQAGNPMGRDLKRIVAERRKAFAYWFSVEAPEMVGADGKPITREVAEDPSCLVLHGIAASSGRVRGVARVIHDPKEALAMRPGEILVTHATDAGWTSVFPLLGGLVTEIGGQLSHAAILAREYGLPAVVDVRGATRLIQDGQVIAVDGATGQVHLTGIDPEMR
jgi:phosphohistidine swiveling domain-containing protein